MDINKLIEELEFGYERAENEDWICFSLEANKDTLELIKNLKAIRNAIREARRIYNDDYELSDAAKLMYDELKVFALA